jgi:hypothetical protein
VPELPADDRIIYGPKLIGPSGDPKHRGVSRRGVIVLIISR